jgi:hypothetical protein
MVTTKKAAGKKMGKRKLKKTTLKNLDAKEAGNVKGGATNTCGICNTKTR